MPPRSPLLDEFLPTSFNGPDEFYDTQLLPRRKPPSPPPTRRSKNASPVIMYNPGRDIESEGSGSPAQTPAPASGGLFRRLTKFFFDLRTFGNRRQDNLPMQAPRENHTLPEWPPLRLEKRVCSCHQSKEKQKKRTRWAIVVLIIILLYLLGNVIALNVRVLSPLRISSSAPSSVSNSSLKLSNDAEQCISRFNLDAPANPPSYPCSSCLPTLQSIPSNFSFSNAQDGQTTQNAIQFCGLTAVFDSASSDAQSNLSNGGFLKDVKFCAWNGVSCDSSGRVSSM
jgi:hypothetical protein